MAREIWSTDFVTDSRTGTDGPLWWGESAQEGCQRTLSRTRGRERTVRCGGESPRRRAVNGPLRVTDSRTGTDGPLWLGRVHAGGLPTDRFASQTRGRERTIRFARGRVHAGGLPTNSVADSRTGTDGKRARTCPCCQRARERGRRGGCSTDGERMRVNGLWNIRPTYQFSTINRLNSDTLMTVVTPALWASSKSLSPVIR